jgi:hypothetical protein
MFWATVTSVVGYGRIHNSAAASIIAIEAKRTNKIETTINNESFLVTQRLTADQRDGRTCGA